ncbi:MAG: rod shape-determining protein MreC [Clostridia bacterium]|nr:rod shape-determining protein MreC [Clostridia bacterium]MDH7573597.1 rod shape-determining protein MreC [Clostridia bacterium]
MTRARAALILVLVAAGLFLARTAGLERPVLSGPEVWLRELVGLAGRSWLWVRDGLEPLGGALFRYEALEAENEALKEEVGRLRAENTRLEEYRLENQRLRRLLALKEEWPEYDLLAARVIGRHPDRWFHTVTIDRGSRDGVAKDMAVMNYQGLVGRVLAVTPTTAQVLLLVDREAAAGALIQETRLPGVVRGTGDPRGRLVMLHLPYDARVEPYQVVVTSGLGGGFPPGVRLGYVLEVSTEPSGLMQRAVVQSFVDFSRLEEVVVVRGYGGR